MLVRQPKAKHCAGYWLLCLVYHGCITVVLLSIDVGFVLLSIDVGFKFNNLLFKRLYHQFASAWLSNPAYTCRCNPPFMNSGDAGCV